MNLELVRVWLTRGKVVFPKNAIPLEHTALHLQVFSLTERCRIPSSLQAIEMEDRLLPRCAFPIFCSYYPHPRQLLLLL